MAELASFLSDPEDLIASPTYQMNLLLWMSQAENRARTPPVLAAAGYSIVGIEERVNLPPRLYQVLQRAKIICSKSVEPDFILKGKKDFLIIECKRTMFRSGGNGKSQKQAASLLALVPRQFESARAMQAGAVTTIHLAYLSRIEEQRDEMSGLEELRERFEENKIPVLEPGFLGLQADVGAVRLKTADTSRLPPRLREHVGSEGVVLQELAPETDCRMLYVIPWLPETDSDKDEYHKAALAERIKVGAAEMISKSRVGRDAYISVGAIVTQLLGDIEKLWKKTSALNQLRQAIASLLARQFEKLPKDAPPAIPQPDLAWAFFLKDEEDKNKVITALMSPGSYDYQDAPMQLTLDSVSIEGENGPLTN